LPAVLTGWGGCGNDLVGDFDGDGKDDLALICYDPAGALWHWQVALSTGSTFAVYPDARVAASNGNGLCVHHAAGGGADRIVVLGAPDDACADLDGSHQFQVTSPCA